MNTRRVTVGVGILIFLLGAGSASAGVGAYDEPAYTKAANNAYWFRWNWNSGGGTDATYYLCFRTFRDNQLVESSTGVEGPGKPNCTHDLRTGLNPPSQGDVSVFPFTPSTVLDDGSRYTVCAGGWFWYQVYWRDDPSGSGCASTVIDRNRPTISASIGGTATVTNNPVLPLRINYSDGTSPPWVGPNGVASNWVCINRGAPCTPAGAPNPHCSAPNAVNSRINSFDCRADATTAPDGEYWFCAMAADSAIPDNPGAANQFAAALSGNANLSAPVCGQVTLDRAPPSVVVSSSATTVRAGDLVRLRASASDPSGVSGAFEWNFGDNTANSSGESTTHTFTQPGTYVVQVTTKDNAGNAGNGTVTVKVESTGVVVPSIRVRVPGRIDLRKTRTLAIIASPSTSGRIAAVLRRRSRTVSYARAELPRAGTYRWKLRLRRSLRSGLYSLTLAFTPTGSTRSATKTYPLRVRSGVRRSRTTRVPREAGRLRSVPAGRRPITASPATHGPIRVR